MACSLMEWFIDIEGHDDYVSHSWPICVWRPSTFLRFVPIPAYRVFYRVLGRLLLVSKNVLDEDHSLTVPQSCKDILRRI